MGADQIETTPRLLSVVSYNIHQCVGTDRRRDATRIAAILKELNADIIGLQEVHSAHDGTFEAYQLRYLAETTGNHVVSGPNVTKANSEYGNVLLTRHSVVRVNRLDLSVPGREARGAIKPSSCSDFSERRKLRQSSPSSTLTNGFLSVGRSSASMKNSARRHASGASRLFFRCSLSIAFGSNHVLR